MKITATSADSVDPMTPTIWPLMRFTDGVEYPCELATLTDTTVLEYLPDSGTYRGLYGVMRAQGMSVLAALEAILTIYLVAGTSLKRSVETRR